MQQPEPRVPLSEIVQGQTDAGAGDLVHDRQGLVAGHDILGLGEFQAEPVRAQSAGGDGGGHPVDDRAAARGQQAGIDVQEQDGGPARQLQEGLDRLALQAPLDFLQHAICVSRVEEGGDGGVSGPIDPAEQRFVAEGDSGIDVDDRLERVQKRVVDRVEQSLCVLGPVIARRGRVKRPSEKVCVGSMHLSLVR